MSTVAIRSSMQTGLRRRTLPFLAFLAMVVTPGIPRADTEKLNRSTEAISHATLAQVGTQTRAGAGVQAKRDALVHAAKKEGEVTLYSAVAAEVNQRLRDAFTAKYGVNVRFTRLSTGPLRQRYAAEAGAGNIAADVVMMSGDAVSYAEIGIGKRWVEPISAAGLPVIEEKEFPPTFNLNATAVIQIYPWLIAYNTHRVKGADIPGEWPDLLHPKWKGRILLVDPRGSDVGFQLWSALADKYGESFLSQLRAQDPRVYANPVPATQALAAGEGDVQLPNVLATVLATKNKGAPLDVIIPKFTTMIELHVMLTARNKAKHPYAARLFANYIMSQEGNKVLNEDPGLRTIYESGTRVPAKYTTPERQALITKLLGF